MRNFRLILFLLFVFTQGAALSGYAQTGQELVDICNMISKDAKYLKDFQVKLNAVQPGEGVPKAHYSVVLQKNTQYRFTICNSKDYSGEGVLQIYDNTRLLGSTYIVATGKQYPYIDLKIQKTGVYHLFVYFKEGEEGLAVALLSYVKNL